MKRLMAKIRQHQLYRSPAVVVLLSTIVLTGCFNSKLVVGRLYNLLDNQIRDEFHKLAEFNDDQIEYFEKRVGTFHVWHRQSELPKYAALLDDIQSSVRERDQTSAADVEGWFDSIETFSKSVRNCYPVNFSFELMQTLTDEQVTFIERRFANERKKNYARYLEKTPDERREDRIERVVTWTGRIGLELNNTQIAMLRDTLNNQISMRKQYYQLVDQWNKDLFIIARNQEAADYKSKMKAHISSLWTLMEITHTEQWQANRKLWRDFAFKFVQSLTYDQRIQAGAWLEKLGNTLGEIAQDEPSFKVTNNPAHGCMVKAS